MNCFQDESKESRSIEDYLFANYKPANSRLTYDGDRQFAKPIEDEDIFGINSDPISTPTDPQQINIDDDDDQPMDGILHSAEDSSNSDLNKRPFHTLTLRTDPCDRDSNRSPDHILEGDDEIVVLNQICTPQKSTQPSATTLDEIFIDDFSCSAAEGRLRNNLNTYQNNENSSHSTTASQKQSHTANTGPSPAQIRKIEMRQRILEQARAMAIKPRKLGDGFDKDGNIEVVIEQSNLVSDGTSKFIFNKLFNNSKKAENYTSPERKGNNWREYSDALRKRISAQRRKVWDSLQAPTDNYNDEEEVIEVDPEEGDEPEVGKPKGDEVIHTDSEMRSDNGNESEQDEVDEADSDVPEEVESSGGEEYDLEEVLLIENTKNRSSKKGSKNEHDIADEENSVSNDDDDGLEDDDEDDDLADLDDEEDDNESDADDKENYIDDQVAVSNGNSSEED